jgi:hypothetical protein
MGVSEGGRDRDAAGVGVEDARCEGEPKGDALSIRLPAGERDADIGAEGDAEALAERVAATRVFEASPEALGMSAVAVSTDEGAPDSLPVREGAPGEGEPDVQPEEVTVAARGVAEGLPDSEGLPDTERDFCAGPEGGREGADDCDCEPLRLTDGEPAALRDAEAAPEELSDGPAESEAAGEALAVREKLLLMLSPRAKEGVPERLAPATVGVASLEREGARESNALPLTAPLGEAAVDWEAELETERDCGGVQEALPLRSGEGLPTGDAVRAAVGAPEEVPPSVAEPRPLKEAAGAD